MADPLANLVAAPAVGYDPRYGGIPQVPNPITSQGAAISGNIGNLGGLYNLAGPANQFNQTQAALGLQTNLPGYQGMIGKSSQNILSQLQGQIPQDVVNAIAQQAAERGISSGVGIGSPNANAALLRSLGLTSLGLQQQGEQNLTQAIGRTPTAQNFDPTKFFVTPEQQQQAQAAANLYGSAPIPAQAARAAMQAAGGIGGAQPGGFRVVGSAPFGSPVTPSPSPGIVPGINTGQGLQIGGVSYGPGQTPQTALNNWQQWYSQIQKTPYAPGTTSFGGGGAQPFQPGDFEDIFGDGSEMSFNDPYQTHAPTYDPYGGGAATSPWDVPVGGEFSDASTAAYLDTLDWT